MRVRRSHGLDELYLGSGVRHDTRASGYACSVHPVDSQACALALEWQLAYVFDVELQSTCKLEIKDATHLGSDRLR
jgi:hypothetical protein